MAPKEKAALILKKFISGAYGKKYTQSNAKIESLKLANDILTYGPQAVDGFNSGYWQQVKEEIELL